MEKDTAPAGTVYYIGDPCYAMTYDEYQDAHELFMDDQFASSYEFKDGRQFAMQPTEFGDGGVTDNEGFGYASDSGMIGMLKAQDIRKEQLETVRTIVQGGKARFVTLPESTVAAAVESGSAPFEFATYADEDFVVMGGEWD